MPRLPGHYRILRRYQSKRTGRMLSRASAKRLKPSQYRVIKIRQSTITGRMVRRDDLRRDPELQRRAETTRQAELRKRRYERLFKGTPAQRESARDLAEQIRGMQASDYLGMTREDRDRYRSFFEWLTEHEDDLTEWTDEEVTILREGWKSVENL